MSQWSTQIIAMVAKLWWPVDSTAGSERMHQPRQSHLTENNAQRQRDPEQQNAVGRNIQRDARDLQDRFDNGERGSRCAPASQERVRWLQAIAAKQARPLEVRRAERAEENEAKQPQDERLRARGGHGQPFGGAGLLTSERRERRDFTRKTTQCSLLPFFFVREPRQLPLVCEGLCTVVR
jgi:hypothetical protein